MATKAELQAELDAAGIAYKARDTVAELEALLAGSGAGVRTRTVEVIEQMVDGLRHYAAEGKHVIELEMSMEGAS